MESMNISLPNPMKRYVEEQVAAGSYGSTSEYLCALVRADRKKRRVLAALQAAVVEGLNSGPGEEATPEFWDKLRERAAQRVRDGKVDPPKSHDLDF